MGAFGMKRSIPTVDLIRTNDQLEVALLLNDHQI